MRVTNRLRPKDTTTVGKVTADPEDVPDSLGLGDIDHFAQFIRGTKVPPPRYSPRENWKDKPLALAMG